MMLNAPRCREGNDKKVITPFNSIEELSVNETAIVVVIIIVVVVDVDLVFLLSFHVSFTATART